MKRWLGRLVAAFVLVVIGTYVWNHWHRIADAVAVPAAPGTAEPTYTEARDAQQTVTMAGPMADFIARQKAGGVETLQPIAFKAVASDHVGGSPVGTSNPILHQTFGVKNVVDLPFDVPAHASTPKLVGTYRSFLKLAGAQAAGEESGEADVEFLLLTEQQYGEFLSGRPSESLFSAEDAHDQEVNTNLPPTRNQAVKYYLVFRNNRHESGKHEMAKTFVQADFQVDF